MHNADNIQVNDVVQINADGPKDWIGCCIQVTTTFTWGVMGFVVIPGKGEAYVRVPYHHCNRIGYATMIPIEEEDNVDRI